MGTRYYARLGRRSGISMPWWLAVIFYSLYAAVVVSIVVLIAAAVIAALLLWLLAVLVDADLARLHRRPRRLHLTKPAATASGESPRGHSY